jgi:hypothetical protein
LNNQKTLPESMLIVWLLNFLIGLGPKNKEARKEKWLSQNCSTKVAKQ